MSTNDLSSLKDKEMAVSEHFETVKGDEVNRDLDSIEGTKPSTWVWMIALAAAIGGLLFGYDTGVISGVLVTIGTALDNRILTDSEKELITSLTSAGAFVGAVVAGTTADKYGRKPAIWFASVLFTVGALIQAVSWSIAQMAVGRFVIGLGVGSAAMIVPLYLSELAPTRFRGRMITVSAFCITGGQVLAYAVDAAFEHVHEGWRYMVGIGGIPSIAMGILLFWCPESPRQLIFHNKPEECARVLGRIYPHATEQQVRDKITVIQNGVNQAVALNEDMSLLQTAKTLYLIPANLRSLVVACGLMAIQQLCGFNVLMYYAATLFSMVGFKNSIAVGSTVACTNWVFTGIALKWVDRIGRRNILVYTMWGMSASLIVAAIAFSYIPINTETLKLETTDAGWAGIVMLVAIIFFVAFYATGLGNVPWTANELMPMEVRAMGTMMVTCTNWGMNIIVSSTFLSMMKGMTPTGSFGFYAGICFLGWLAVIFCYPECAQMTLEETRAVFEHGFGVRYASKWRKERLEELGSRNHAAGGFHV